MNIRPAGIGRLAIGLAVVTGMVVGALTGLSRAGLSFGGLPAVAAHGPLFALGFLGTVIGMERAVALKRPWAWLVPGVSAAAIAGLILEFPTVIPATLLTVGGLGLGAVFVVAHRIQPELHIRVMAAGAACWVLGAAGLLLGLEVFELVPAMAGFLVLTILGERLELARFIGVSRRSRRWLLAATALVVAGAMFSLWDVGAGALVSGIGLMAAATWLARNDVAKRTVKIPGVTRYMAAALLAGYAWLAVAGVIWTVSGLTPGTFSYDAAVHVVFLGFVFSMVFAHAPIIVPALTGMAVPYQRWFWVPLSVLHASLLVRVFGDLSEQADVRRLGGIWNAIAIALFAAVLVSALVQGRRAVRG